MFGVDSGSAKEGNFVEVDFIYGSSHIVSKYPFEHNTGYLLRIENATFSPISGTPTFTSTMTISTLSSTPAGTYTITITGTGGGLTRTCTYTLVVTRTWLFMVYMVGDCDLEGAAIGDINEMEKVGSTDRVKIVVQLDRIDGSDTSNDNWTDTRRYYITQDTDTQNINSQLVQDLDEINMGDPNSLVYFATWALNNYPANTNVLVLWGHGKGVWGVCQDFSSVSDILTMAELKQAMNSIRASLGRNLDIIGFDACLMQMVEVGYQIQGTADIIVGSEETTHGDGWPYDDILSYLTSHYQMSPDSFASVIVDNYIKSYDGGSQGYYSSATLSAFWINSIKNNIAPAVSVFAQRLIDSIAGWRQQINDARSNTEFYDAVQYPVDSPFRDFSGFGNEIKNRILNSDVQSAAQTVMNAITSPSGRIAEGHISHQNSHGLSIYFPPNASFQNYKSFYESLDFAIDTKWNDFLNAYLV